MEDLGNTGDAVAAGHDERGQGRRGQGRNDGVTALVHVDLTVPLAPDLGGRKHAALAAHVAKGGLPRAVGTATRHTGDTGHGAAGTWETEKDDNQYITQV